MSGQYEEYQVENFEQEAYQGAMLKAGKEWERVRSETDETESQLQSRILELEAENKALKDLSERLISVGEQRFHPERAEWNLHVLTEDWNTLVTEWQKSKEF